MIEEPDLAYETPEGASMLDGFDEDHDAFEAVPTVMRKTAADQLRHAAAVRKVTLNNTLRSAARNTANIIDNPRKRRRIVRLQ